MKKVMYSCAEHIEELLEVFLDESEEMPVMEESNDATLVCNHCQQTAKYQLLGSEVKTTWE